MHADSVCLPERPTRLVGVAVALPLNRQRSTIDPLSRAGKHAFPYPLAGSACMGARSVTNENKPLCLA